MAGTSREVQTGYRIYRRDFRSQGATGACLTAVVCEIGLAFSWNAKKRPQDKYFAASSTELVYDVPIIGTQWAWMNVFAGVRSLVMP